MFVLLSLTLQVNFGIIFDIDGVLGRGSTPFAATKRMINLLTDEDGNLVVPISFCTNSSGTAADKAERMTEWLDTKVCPLLGVSAVATALCAIGLFEYGPEQSDI